MKFSKNNILKTDKSSAPKATEHIVSRIITSFQRFGKEESEECKASEEMYTIHLKQIESGHIVKKEESSKEQLDEISEKEQKINRLQQDIADKDQEIKRIKEVLIKEKDDEIKEIKNEKEILEKSDPRNIIDTGPIYKPWLFYIGTFISLLLILFIYYFYVNLGYVLFDLPTNFPPQTAFQCHPEVLNSMEQLMGKGGCQTEISIGPLLLPILFLAIAILIHFKLENAMHKEGKKMMAWIGISFFLLLVLVLDTILAIKFEERLFNWNGSGGPYGNPFPSGLLEQLKYSYKEPAFLLILGLGFVGYIIWSFITHEASKEYEKKNPENVWRRRLRQLESKIAKVQGERTYLLQKANHLIPDEIRKMEKEMADIKQSIKLIQIGGKDRLRQALIEFTIGWNQYIQFRYADQGAKEKISAVAVQLNTFITSSSILKDTHKVAKEEISALSLN